MVHFTAFLIVRVISRLSYISRTIHVAVLGKIFRPSASRRHSKPKSTNYYFYCTTTRTDPSLVFRRAECVQNSGVRTAIVFGQSLSHGVADETRPVQSSSLFSIADEWCRRTTRRTFRRSFRQHFS